MSLLQAPMGGCCARGGSEASCSRATALQACGRPMPRGTVAMWARPLRQRRQRRATQHAVRGTSSDGSTGEVSLAELQQRLNAAVEDEDYASAAALRDELARRREDGRLAVEEANAAFYRAFQAGDIREMDRIWGQGEHVQCIHPAAECIAGREEVMESWRLVLSNADFDISLEDVRIYAGETDAFVTCVEVVDSGDSRGRIVATNVFEKQDGEWRIVHHHGSPAGMF